VTIDRGESLTGHSTESRVAAAAAAAFTAAFVVGSVALGDVVGALGDRDAVFVDHYASGARRAADIAGGSALIVSGLALVVLGAAVRRMFAEALAAGVAAQALTASGAIVAVGGGLFAATPLSMSFGDLFDDSGQFAGGHAAVLPQAATVVVLMAAYPLAALAAAALAIAARAANALPAWHFWVSIACAAAMPVAMLYVPIVALPAWSAATSVALWRSRRPDELSENTPA
jgi:hypothetical protein